MQIFTPLMQGLGTALGLYQQRHAVLAENVANAETPGYRARDLDFGHVLESAFDGAPGGRTGAGGVEPTVDTKAVIKVDRNSVDIDTEMARLSENALRIVALTRLISGSYAGLKRAIGEVR